jgi:transcriptional regulator with XRE-family HTH domain
MGFKENLRRLREEAGLTQTQMADKAGVPFRSYQNWEAGSREPGIAALAALAKALGVSVDQLISESEADPKKPQQGRHPKSK